MKPTVSEALPLVIALYGRSFVGCCWHVVLDDGNIGDDTVKWCVDRIRLEGCMDTDNPGATECVALCDMLPAMSRTQRQKLYRHPLKRLLNRSKAR